MKFPFNFYWYAFRLLPQCLVQFNRVSIYTKLNIHKKDSLDFLFKCLIVDLMAQKSNLGENSVVFFCIILWPKRRSRGLMGKSAEYATDCLFSEFPAFSLSADFVGLFVRFLEGFRSHLIYSRIQFVPINSATQSRLDIKTVGLYLPGSTTK